MIEPLVMIPPMLCDARVYYAQLAALSGELPITFVPITRGERIEEMASAILSWLPNKFALAGMGMGGHGCDGDSTPRTRPRDKGCVYIHKRPSRFPRGVGLAGAVDRGGENRTVR